MSVPKSIVSRLNYKSLCRYDAKRDYVFTINLKDELVSVLGQDKVEVVSSIQFSSEPSNTVKGSWQATVMVPCSLCGISEKISIRDTFRLHLVLAYSRDSVIDEWLVDADYWDVEKFFNDEIDVNLPKHYLHDDCKSEMNKFINTGE